jgi:hypothetical protein
LIALPAPVFLAAALVRRDLSALFLGCQWPGWQRRGVWGGRILDCATEGDS